MTQPIYAKRIREVRADPDDYKWVEHSPIGPDVHDFESPETEPLATLSLDAPAVALALTTFVGLIGLKLYQLGDVRPAMAVAGAAVGLGLLTTNTDVEVK